MEGGVRITKATGLLAGPERDEHLNAIRSFKVAYDRIMPAPVPLAGRWTAFVEGGEVHILPNHDGRLGRGRKHLFGARMTADLDEANALNARFRDLMKSHLREPRWLYFESTVLPGWRFGWTTERDHEGTFASFVQRPIGPGSRTGTAKRYKQERIAYHKKRKDARARAERLLVAKKKERGV